METTCKQTNAKKVQTNANILELCFLIFGRAFGLQIKLQKLEETGKCKKNDGKKKRKKCKKNATKCEMLELSILLHFSVAYFSAFSWAKVFGVAFSGCIFLRFNQV